MDFFLGSLIWAVIKAVGFMLLTKAGSLSGHKMTCFLVHVQREKRLSFLSLKREEEIKFPISFQQTSP